MKLFPCFAILMLVLATSPREGAAEPDTQLRNVLGSGVFIDFISNAPRINFAPESANDAPNWVYELLAQLPKGFPLAYSPSADGQSIQGAQSPGIGIDLYADSANRQDALQSYSAYERIEAAMAYVPRLAVGRIKRSGMDPDQEVVLLARQGLLNSGSFEMGVRFGF